MGCVGSSQDARVSPENVNEGNSMDQGEYIAVKRTCNDVTFLLLMVAFVIVQIGLLAYSMSYGDIYRIVNGYDDCGNICGRENAQYEDLGCSGTDHRKAKYLLVNPSLTLTGPELVYRICVESCENQGSYQKYLNRCLPIKDSRTSKVSFFSKTGLKNFFQEVSEDLEICWEQICYLCIYSLVISLVLVIALRFVVGFIVWLILIGIILVLICGTVFLWLEYAYTTDEEEETILVERKHWLLAFSILITIATVCICLIIFALRKRIGLVIQLFKEAGKALTSMPMLLFEPILTFLALTFFASLWIYFAIHIESAGKVMIKNNQSIQYVKDTAMLISRWYNLLALFWFANFVIGCQHVVIAGAVAWWFFTRNKTKLSSPILKSFRNLVFYHLGTVAEGSFFLALVNLIRTMLKWLMVVSKRVLKDPQNIFLKCCATSCQCCICIFEKFLQYISRNAYIETELHFGWYNFGLLQQAHPGEHNLFAAFVFKTVTAIESSGWVALRCFQQAITGQPFCSSAKRAFNLLTNNALRVVAINSVGDFILLLIKAFIVLSTIIIGIELIQKKEKIHHSWVPLTIAGLFAYFVAHCFISVYEMTIDTIFICFCEDCDQNDGINRPYYMSRGLMEFIQNSKKVLRIIEEKNGKAWLKEDT